jgi:hypothetical protein
MPKTTIANYNKWTLVMRCLSIPPFLMVFTLSLKLAIISTKTQDTIKNLPAEQDSFLMLFIALTASILVSLSDWIIVADHNALNRRAEKNTPPSTTVYTALLGADLTEQTPGPAGAEASTGPATFAAADTAATETPTATTTADQKQPYIKRCRPRFTHEHFFNLAMSALMSFTPLTVLRYSDKKTTSIPEINILIIMTITSSACNAFAGIPCLIDPLKTNTACSNVLKTTVTTAAIGGSMALLINAFSGFDIDTTVTQIAYSSVFFAFTFLAKLPEALLPKNEKEELNKTTETNVIVIK